MLHLTPTPAHGSAERCRALRADDIARLLLACEAASATAVIRVRSNGVLGSIAVADGQVAAASLAGVPTHVSLSALLALETGEFEVAVDTADGPDLLRLSDRVGSLAEVSMLEVLAECATEPRPLRVLLRRGVDCAAIHFVGGQVVDVEGNVGALPPQLEALAGWSDGLVMVVVDQRRPRAQRRRREPGCRAFTLQGVCGDAWVEPTDVGVPYPTEAELVAAAAVRGGEAAGAVIELEAELPPRGLRVCRELDLFLARGAGRRRALAPIPDQARLERVRALSATDAVVAGPVAVRWAGARWRFAAVALAGLAGLAGLGAAVLALAW
jgi:hypothetical protein